MPYVQSDALEAVAYDESSHRLRAKFRGDGHTVVYEGVPLDLYDALLFSDSIGRFFRERIEGAYPARNIEDAPANKR